MSNLIARLPRRDLALLGGLFALLAALTALVQPYLPRPQAGPQPTLSIHSSRGDGARALALWLEDLGYRVDPIEHRPFDVGRQVRALFVLAPSAELTEGHASAIAEWVQGGGTLVLVAERSNRLLERLGVEVHSRMPRLSETVPLQPIFWSPSLSRSEVDTTVTLRPRGPEWVPILGAPESEGGVVAAVATVGRGRAFVLGAQHPLSNRGLGQADNWELALHFLVGVPPGSIVAFDEYHHGLTEHGTLAMRALREPWGWAVLYSGALLFAFMALSGRRFGRAVLPPGVVARRTRVEYVATLAGLLHQGGHRQWLQQQFAAQVKRDLGSRYLVRSDLPAADFAAALAARRPEAAALAAPLARLEAGQPPGDAALVALMRDVDAIRARLLGS